MNNDEPSEKVPYDENAWERIVAELGGGMPQLPPEVPATAPEEPEEDYVPPEPPPLPQIDTLGRFAWAGTIGGPLLLFGGVLAPGIVGPAAVTVGIAAFVLGFLTLVLRSPNEPEDGWDDGSVV